MICTEGKFSSIKYLVRIVSYTLANVAPVTASSTLVLLVLEIG